MLTISLGLVIAYAVIILLFTHNSWEIIWAIVVFQNQLGHENNICHSGQFLFLALVIAVWSIFLIWDCPTKSSKLSGLVARIVCFCVVVSIFLISISCMRNFYKLGLRYYFFYQLQEKDFFDKRIIWSKKLNVYFILSRMNVWCGMDFSFQSKWQKKLTSFEISFLILLRFYFL